MQSIIRFLKEIYLTGFAVTFNLSRVKDIAFKAGGAIGLLTVLEWLLLIGISGYLEMFLNKKLTLIKPIIIIAFFTLFTVNGYFLYFRGHGIDFATKFHNLKKSRRVLLVLSFVVLSSISIVLFVLSGIAYRHFIGVN
ncbi:MAG TPA: hypothetical protein VGY56_10175 [Verrucomicrobiae bacterium]|nr:hypothetical protein [Verrucomicrobiae bacterium]